MKVNVVDAFKFSVCFWYQNFGQCWNFHSRQGLGPDMFLELGTWLYVCLTWAVQSLNWDARRPNLACPYKWVRPLQFALYCWHNHSNDGAARCNCDSSPRNEDILYCTIMNDPHYQLAWRLLLIITNDGNHASFLMDIVHCSSFMPFLGVEFLKCANGEPCSDF